MTEISSEQQIWFISGTSRGIGLALAQVVAQHGHIVFAGARNPSTAKRLQDLANTHKNVHIIKHEATSISDAAEAVRIIDKFAGGIDVVVPNAAHIPIEDLVPVKDAKAESMAKAHSVNTIGPILLFQAFYPLLMKRKTRKFIPISSIAGSITHNLPRRFSASSYGASKAALNYLTKQIARENRVSGLIAFPMHPGMVDSDESPKVAKLLGMERFPMSCEESAEALYKVIDEATIERSGKFMSYDGTELAW